MKACQITTLLLGAALAGPAAAQSVVSTGQSHVQVRLLPGSAEPDGVRTAGLELTLAPGWKTYWRAPGEAGVPPRFDWSGSGNLLGTEVLWPAPHVFDSFGYRTVGYDGRVVLPVRLVPEDPARPIAVEVDLALGVCREICMFEEVHLAAEFPPDLAEETAAVRAAVEAVPGRGGVVDATCTIEGAGTDRAVTARLVFDGPVRATHAVLEGPAESWTYDTGFTAEGAEAVLTATLGLPDPGAWVGRSDLRFTLLGDGYAAEIEGCTAPAG